MYCKAGVQCTNPEIYGDIKRGRRLAPSKGIICPRCTGKCCNEACLDKHKCKMRARPPSMQGRAGQHARWQGLDPSMGFDPNMAGLLDPNMALALARAGQGGLLLNQGGNMMPAMVPILQFPLMFNAAALQQAGADGSSDAGQLQAALAAMGAGGMSAPMMLAPMGGPGTPTADPSGGMSQALQLAQLQQLQAGLGGPLLQFTLQPDGSTGLVQAGGNGQRMPQGLMQGMPLQLSQGLQLLSAEQLQLAGGDGSNGMPLMQIMADGSTVQMDQATMNAVAAAAAAGGLDGGMLAGLTAMGANLGALAGVSASDAQAFFEQQQQQLELNAAAAAAVAAAAAEGMPDGLGDPGADPSASNEAAAAGMPGGLLGPVEGEGGLADPHAAADMSAAAQQGAELLTQQQADAAEAGGADNPGDPPGDGEGLPPGATLVGSEGLMLPAIPPLHMQGMGPAIAAALQAASAGRAGYNAEEDTAAAALMSLATDKKKTAAARASAAARAAVEAANEGIIPRSLADSAVQEAEMLQAEAEAEEAAAAAQQQQQASASAGGGGKDAVKMEQLPGLTEEQLQQLQLQIMQQQQMAMLQHHHNQQQALAQQVAEQQQQQAHFEQQQQLQQQQHLEAHAQPEHAQQHLQHQYEQQ